MGCLTACFVTWKHKEIKKNNVQEQCLSPSCEPVEAMKLLADTAESLEEDEVHDLVSLSESEAKTQEQINCSNENKAAVDHPNMETDTNKPSSNINVSNENETGERRKDDKECIAMNSNHESTSDDDPKGLGIEDCCPTLEESSESLFSLSLDSRKQVCASEMGEKEVSSNPVSSQPIETGKGSSFEDDDDKENVNLDENRMFLSMETMQKPKDSEIVCDTSLSSWLVESEKSFQKGSVGGNSPESEKNYGERRILGAISGGLTPGCSGDDQPGIGTVGRYWMAGRAMDVGRGTSSVSTKV